MYSLLLDTSIWVEFFRERSSAVTNRVLQLLDEDRIVTNGVIITELLLGAERKKESRFIKENLTKLQYLDADKKFFVYCG
ncbi:MAG: PIN domain-containing protein, partial [bacterium]|nr:PIN domain-containing protein [bacterium]